MKKYETLIFDLDDTLIDNNESLKYAFTIIINKLKISFSNELFEEWKKADTAYWYSWESGKIVIPDNIKTLEDRITYIRAYRFMLFFKDLNLSFEEAVNINEIYCSMLGVNIVEIKDAKKLLEDLYPSYKILIATNGPKDAAINKIKKAKLDSYIASLICSEEVGFNKPMREFFEYLYQKINNYDKSKMLIIGDSLTTDILSGMYNGIDSCWFNPNNNPLPSEYKPTMEINKLLELKKKL